MTEQPILFSAPMVRAILEGRKSQTRRVLSRRWTIDGSPSGALWDQLDWSTAEARSTSTLMDAVVGRDNAHRDPHLRVRHVDGDTWHRVRPRIETGDSLWVRETIKQRPMENFLTGEPTNAIVAAYAADDEDVVEDYGFNLCPWWKGGGALSAIHMPRWASRITLAVTDVRVERLQEISEDDAVAEGVDNVAAFASLIDDLHGNGAWRENPWVCAVTFPARPMPEPPRPEGALA